MLDRAIEVVEAARNLRLARNGNVTVSGLDGPMKVAVALENLRAAIEKFDRETGAAPDGALLRPDYAMPEPDPDPDGLPQPGPRPVRGRRVKDPALEPPEDDLEAEPGEELVIPPPVMKPGPAPKPEPGKRGSFHDMMDGAVFDGDESVADLLLSIKSIDAKLGFAVKKVGWSPRLRQLAEAARIANRNMYVEVDGGGTWVRMPAFKFASMSVAVAEAALDQDLSIALPQPKPSHDRDLEYRNTPRPPDDWLAQ